MSNNRKRSLEHAKKTQRPMVEDEVIANQLEALLTPAITARENRDLGVIKSIRKPRVRLIIAPFPDRQKNEEDFFFSPNPQIP